jgi:hypothetical protein
VRYGAATGDPTPERHARLDEALDYYIKTWKPAKRSRLKVTKETMRRRRGYWLSVLSHHALKQFCAPGIMVDFQGGRFEIHRRLSIDHTLLAAAELVCWHLLRTKGTIPVQSLQRELKKLKMSRDGKHCRAILTLFAQRGIFRCTNASYRFGVPSASNEWNQSDGEARQWEPAPGARIPESFQNYFSHRVDARGRARYSPAEPDATSVSDGQTSKLWISVDLQATITMMFAGQLLRVANARVSPSSPVSSEENMTQGAAVGLGVGYQEATNASFGRREEEIWINRSEIWQRHCAHSPAAAAVQCAGRNDTR